MKLIVACEKNGGIGFQGKLPWDKISGDLQRFKQLTEKGVVVMGRKTWESLPKKPLPNRVNVIISKSMPSIEDAIVLPNIGRLKDAPGVWIIGGQKLIESVYDNINEIHLTQTFATYKSDIFIDLKRIYNDFKIVKGSGHGDHNYEVLQRK